MPMSSCHSASILAELNANTNEYCRRKAWIRAGRRIEVGVKIVWGKPRKYQLTLSCKLVLGRVLD